VCLVIGMGLFRARSIAQVVEHLDLVLPTAGGARQFVTHAAIVQARNDLGAAHSRPCSHRRRPRGPMAPRRTIAGAGWRSTAWMAPPCASPTRPRMSPTSGARRAARVRGRLPAAAPRHALRAARPACSRPRPGGPTAPVKWPWPVRSGPRCPRKTSHTCHFANSTCSSPSDATKTRYRWSLLVTSRAAPATSIPTPAPEVTFQNIHVPPQPGVASAISPTGSIITMPHSGPRRYHWGGQRVMPTSSPMVRRAL
jgi:hypothetical protein